MAITNDSVKLKAFKDYFFGSLDNIGEQYKTKDGKVKWRSGKTSKIFNQNTTIDILIERHLSKQITIGSYPYYRINGDPTWYCQYIMIDIDDHGSKDKISVVKNLNSLSKEIKQKLIDHYGISEFCILRDFSGRGYHVWIKLGKLTTLSRAWDFKIDIENFLEEEFNIEIEVFPKQSTMDSGSYGNCCKLPLSINRNNGEFSNILDGFDLTKQGYGYKIPYSIPECEKVKKPKKVKKETIFHSPGFEDYKPKTTINNIDFSKLERPYQDLLNGKFAINEYSERIGIEEFHYWKDLFWHVLKRLVLYHYDLYPILEKNQPEFSREKTEEQLQYTYNDYRLTKEQGFIKKSKKELYPDYYPKEKAKESDRLTIKEESDLIAEAILGEFDILTLNDSRQSMIRQGIFYTFDMDVITKALNDKISKLSKGNYKSIKSSILEIIKDSTLFSRNDFCYDGKLMVFKNGTLDFETDIFYPQGENQPFKFFYEIPFDYDPEGQYKCPRYKRALRQWLGNPFSNFRTRDMFEIIGYCLTMNVSLKKAFISYGDTNSGKTQNTNIISELFHEKNKTHLTLQRVCKNEFGTHGLQFKVLNICDDLPEKKLLHVGTFKDITGGGLSIGGEVKGGNKYSFRSVVKFIFNANQIPAIESKNDMAFFERFILIPFPNQFSINMNNSIPDFYKMITTDDNEMKGIIHEAIKGYKRLLERKGFRPVILKDTKHIWNYESDPLYRFLYDYCKKDKFERILVNDFVEKYNEESEIALTKGKITIDLQKHGIYKKYNQIEPYNPENQKKAYYYYGINWENEEMLEEL